MNQFVESLRRLYKEGKINISTLSKFLGSKKINRQEYDYITSAENATEEVV